MLDKHRAHTFYLSGYSPVVPNIGGNRIMRIYLICFAFGCIDNHNGFVIIFIRIFLTEYLLMG